MSSEDRRLVYQAASVLLAYPDDDLFARLPLVAAAVGGMGRLQPLLAYLTCAPQGDLQRHYVDVFDLTGKRCLYLTYYTDGDTRRRGSVLAELKARYRASGFLVDTHGELPDYLPLVLEYAALADPADGYALLLSYRPALELLRLSLVQMGTPYAAAVEAVCATLPGPSPKDAAEVMRMAAAGPPREEVGLEEYGAVR